MERVAANQALKAPSPQGTPMAIQTAATPMARSSETKWPAREASFSYAERGVRKKLWQLYEADVMPLESRSFFEHFHAPPITSQEFEARPQVLLLGQYSTGKTSMVRWLTGCDTKHFDIKPQPSTDKFMAVVHGTEEQLIYGDAAACMPQLPYQGLAKKFGATALGNFHALAMQAPILEDLTFVDTPGVLAGSKQRIGRAFDFAEVAEWMAERADLVLMTFDAHKLDISDEFQEVMERLKPHASKVRCVLNKADQIDSTNLVRVYGALLWNVGKVLQTPEVARVYISSFWDAEYRYKDHQKLFDEDKAAILKELQDLPRNALLRRVNNFASRIRKVKAHMCLVSHIKSQLPWVSSIIGSERQLHKYVEQRLPTLFEETQRLRGLSAGDMPNMEAFGAKIASLESLTSLPAWDAEEVARLDRIVDFEIPKLMGDVSGVSAALFTCREAPAQPAAASTGFLGSLFGSKRKRESA